VRHLSKSNVDSQQISLRLVGSICGLIGGGICFWFVSAIIGLIYLLGIEAVFPGPHSAKAMLEFYICLYGVWLLIIWLFVRKIELAFWGLVMFPMPTMLFAVFWLLKHGQQL
jgi:hypothetical protein